MLNLYNANNHSAPLPSTPSGAPKNGKKNFERYESPGGEFTGKELRAGFWYVKHRLLLYRLLVWGLLAFAAINWGFSLWRWGDYLIFGLSADRKLEQNLSRFFDYTVIHEHYSPQPLQVLGTQVLNGGVDKYDAVAEVANGNSRWLARFDYFFSVGGENTPKQSGWVLPGEEKPLVFLGLKSASYPGDAVLVLENISWSRVSNHSVPDTKRWQEERLNFSTSDFSFTRPETAEGISAHAVRFKLANNSPYGYVQPKFYVGLFLDQSMVGILPLELDSLRSLEIKNIDLRSFAQNLSVNDVKIFPLINPYDPAAYLPPEK